MDNTIETKQQIAISFDGVKMKDFRDYWDAVRKGDWHGQDAFFAKVVRAWPYDLDPNDVGSYGALSLGAYAAVQDAVKATSLNERLRLSRGEKLER